MPYSIQELVIRSVAPVDITEITRLLAAAMGDGPVARWLAPDPDVRRDYAPVYATADDAGDMSGVALWFPLTSLIPPPADYDVRLKDASGLAFDRARELDAALEAHHPMEPHHYLAFIAVHPRYQNRGIGSALLDRHHARLDAAGLPAYLEANDPRNRDLYLRHGYECREAIRLPDGPPIWPMWRMPQR
jgi:GNAT superfamily N-acetyltransferase